MASRIVTSGLRRILPRTIRPTSAYIVAAATRATPRISIAATTRWAPVQRRSYSVDSQAGQPGEIEQFDFEKVQELLRRQPENYVIVDSREPGELVQTGTMPTAINIPISSAPDCFQIHNEDFEDRFGFERPGKDKTLLFFCKAGVRSHAAARLASDAGWKTAEYPGSWLDWVAKGGDITHSYN